MTTRPTPRDTPAVTQRDLEQHAPAVSAKGTREVTGRIPRIDAEERVTMIAHDLKTPLSIILLETQILGERLPPEPAIRHSLSRITQNVAYIDRLIADLLDLASVEAGLLHQQLRLERVDLGTLLDETLERAVSSVDRGRVQLEIRQVAIVRADRGRIERVIANLISNALKYSAAPVTIALECQGPRARVCVIDQGRGLTLDQARTVFDRYRRESNTRGRDGYGLGLYISRKIVDAHGGEIGVQSVAGQGSEFFFELDTIE